MERKPMTFTLAGAGLAAALLLGCQGLAGQDSSSNTQDTQAALLSLAVKDSGDCAGLHARCAQANGAGEDPAALVDALVGNCIIDTAKAREILERGRGHQGPDGRGPGGREGGPGREGDRGRRLDSAARAALCDSLKTSLAAADSTAEDYPWLVRETRHPCEEKRPPLSPGRPDGRHGGPRGRHGR